MADEKKAKGEQQAQGQQKPKGDKPAKGESQKASGKGGDKGGKKGKGEGVPQPSPSRTRLSTTEAVPPRLLDKYKAEVIPALTKQFNYKNPNQVPRLQKIVVNMGL